jgi:hypothetical protein
MIFVVSKGWLLNKIKIGIENHGEYVLETLEAARFLQITTIELKQAILNKELLNGYIPPDTYKVGNKYYFLFNDLLSFKNKNS